MKRSRGFIRSEGSRRGRRGKGGDDGNDNAEGRYRIGRGLHPWRTPSTMTRSTAPSLPDRVLIIITSKTTPRTTMMKRVVW